MGNNGFCINRSRPLCANTAFQFLLKRMIQNGAVPIHKVEIILIGGGIYTQFRCKIFCPDVKPQHTRLSNPMIVQLHIPRDRHTLFKAILRLHIGGFPKYHRINVFCCLLKPCFFHGSGSNKSGSILP